MKLINPFFALLLLTVAFHSNVLAENVLNDAEITLLEDFEDVEGNPAFDSNFIYEFLPRGNPPRETIWYFCDDDYFLSTPERKPFLFFNGLLSIEFNLPENSFVHSVSLDLSIMARNTSVTFIGASNNKIFEWPGWPDSHDFQTVSASSDEIGNISSIRISCAEGHVDNIVVQATVVPEPTTICAMFLLFVTIAFMKISRNHA